MCFLNRDEMILFCVVILLSFILALCYSCIMPCLSIIHYIIEMDEFFLTLTTILNTWMQTKCILRLKFWGSFLDSVRLYILVYDMIFFFFNFIMLFKISWLILSYILFFMVLWISLLIKPFPNNRIIKKIKPLGH